MRHVVLAIAAWLCADLWAEAEYHRETDALDLFERICLQGDLHVGKMKKEITEMVLPEIGSRAVDSLIRGILPAERIGFQCAPDIISQCYVVLSVSGKNSAMARRLNRLGLATESDQINPLKELTHPFTGEPTGIIGGKSCVVYGQVEDPLAMVSLVSGLELDGVELRSPDRVNHFNDAKSSENGNPGEDNRWTNYYWGVSGGNHLNLSIFVDRADTDVNFELSYSGPVKSDDPAGSYRLR